MADVPFFDAVDAVCLACVADTPAACPTCPVRRTTLAMREQRGVAVLVRYVVEVTIPDVHPFVDDETYAKRKALEMVLGGEDDPMTVEVLG